jgi:malate/lactate dehydrogenase
LKDLAISLPSVVSKMGVSEVLELKMDQKEHDQFLNSAQVISNAIDSVTIT